MKRFRILAVTLSLLVFVAMLVGCAGSETVSLFPDKNLEAAVRDALGKQAGEEITVAELANLTTLSARNSDITDLSGIEYCTNLTELDLSNNKISDISALSSLTNLSWLNLNDNLINNIWPLVKNSGLSAGDTVDLRDNPLSSISLNVYIPQLDARGVDVEWQPL